MSIESPILAWAGKELLGVGPGVLGKGRGWVEILSILQKAYRAW